MRVSGRVQQGIWRFRILLRQIPFVRSIVRRIRNLGPDSRARHLRAELKFWKRWLDTEGLDYPGDYALRFDPAAPVQEHLARVIDRIAAPAAEILDVGAGPITAVGKRHPTKAVTVVATDILASEYDALLAGSGLTPPVRTVYADTERLREALGNRQFDIVHAQNSLDHTNDAIAALEEMVAVTRPGGFVVLLHEENEGRNELYNALHKWDFSCDAGHFIISGPGPDGPRRDITEMLSHRAEVECSIQWGEVLVVIHRRG